MKVAIHTLGCKVNQYETQAMELLLKERGHQLVAFEEAADAYIINSCTVTAVSDRKSRQAVYQAQRRGEGAVIALCGCYPQVSPEETEQLGADLVGGTGDREAFLTHLEEVWKSKQHRVAIDDALRRRTFEKLPGGGLSGRTRAMLKVEDGCVNFCSYCIIPYARGPVRSLPLAAAVEEAKRLAQEGYQEIVLTGIELSSWGKELSSGESLMDLIEGIALAAPTCRIRLGSLEPRSVTEEFCQRMARIPNLCGHFHLSLQSGCDETLRRMNRKYDTARYLESLTLLRKYFTAPGITTDLIVGFPGESEEAFQQTLDFITCCAFSDLHIFPYSIRSGTPAATMPGQLSKQEKAERAARAEKVAARLRRQDQEMRIGSEAEVLWEEQKDGLWRGHSKEYVEVVLPSERNLKNQVCRVEITAMTPEGLLSKEKGETG